MRVGGKAFVLQLVVAHYPVKADITSLHTPGRARFSPVQPATVGWLRQVSRAERLDIYACAITQQASSSWNPLSR
jgi:hypothetical protein